MHFNLSFTDTKGHNAIATGDKGDPDHLNALSKGCIAGWMKHHKGLAGLVAPNALSYARLQPASLSACQPVSLSACQPVSLLVQLGQ